MERIKRRFPVVFLTIGILLVAIAMWFTIGLYGYRQEERRRVERSEEAYRQLVGVDSAARDAVREALRSGDSQSLEKALALIAMIKDRREQLLIRATLLPRLIEAEGVARDLLLNEAFDIKEANPASPEIVRLIESARPREEKALELLKNVDQTIEEMRGVLPPEEFRRWAATLRYLQGYTEFLGLPFIMSDEEQKAREIVDRSREAFLKVFPLIPKESRTEYALESLYQVAKKQQDGSGQQGQTGKGKKPMLLQRPGDKSVTGTPGRGI